MVMTGKIKRRNYLIDKRFQLKYTGLILLFMFLVAAVVAYTVYYTGWMLMGERLANVYPQGRLVTIMKTINMTLIVRLLVLAPLVAVVAILLSHKIAGPLYRIERFLRLVAHGDFSSRLRLRKYDELQGLADSVNEMTDDLRGRVQKVKSLVNMVNLDLEKLRRNLGGDTPNIDAIRQEILNLEKSIKDLDDHLSEYRVTTVED